MVLHCGSRLIESVGFGCFSEPLLGSHGIAAGPAAKVPKKQSKNGFTNVKCTVSKGGRAEAAYKLREGTDACLRDGHLGVQVLDLLVPRDLVVARLGLFEGGAVGDEGQLFGLFFLFAQALFLLLLLLFLLLAGPLFLFALLPQLDLLGTLVLPLVDVLLEGGEFFVVLLPGLEVVLDQLLQLLGVLFHALPVELLEINTVTHFGVVLDATSEVSVSST